MSGVIFNNGGPSLLDLPNFVKARTAKGLVKAMLDNNTQLKAYVRYFDIQYCPAEKAWFAWYFIDIERLLGGS